MNSAPGKVAPVAVIGLGNVLLGDDGFGPYVVELLNATWVLPQSVELIDAGTPGLGLASFFCRRRLVILVDAVASQGEPGSLRRYGGEDLRRIPPQPRVSPHDPAIAETLDIAAMSGEGPHTVVLIGAIPARTAPGIGLSEALRVSARAAVGMIVSELSKHDVHAVQRHLPETNTSHGSWVMRHA